MVFGSSPVGHEARVAMMRASPGSKLQIDFSCYPACNSLCRLRCFDGYKAQPSPGRWPVKWTNGQTDKPAMGHRDHYSIAVEAKNLLPHN
jgi:hypothetical protein